MTLDVCFCLQCPCPRLTVLGDGRRRRISLGRIRPTSPTKMCWHGKGGVGKCLVWVWAGLCFQQRIIFIPECVTASTVCMLSKREQFTADPVPKRLLVFTWPKDAGRGACCVGCRCFGRPSCCHHRMPSMTTSKQQLHKIKEHWWLRAHAALPSRSQLPVAQQIEVRDEHPV
jgi:hypothetical protein